MAGISPDQESVDSETKKSSISSGGRAQDRKEFLRRFVDIEVLKANLEDWLEDLVEDNPNSAFELPFELVDLQKFDYALEGVPFQQLIRMPSAIYASTSSDVEATAYLALEDFLHASVNGMWEAFWGPEDDIMPFYVSSLFEGNLRFYQAEQAIAKGKIGGLCAAAIMLRNPRHPQGKWDDIIELALLRPDIGNHSSAGENSNPPVSTICEALFFALRVLLARSISRSNIPRSLNSVFVLLVDSHCGGVVKVEGDLSKLDCDLNNVYESAAAWIRNHSKISISPVDRIWNKLGNANLEACIDYLCNYITTKGPFHGLLGFSQGASLSALLLGYQAQGKILKDHPPISLFISISGSKFRDPTICEAAYKDPIKVRSVHFVGEKDWLKLPSEELAAAFEDPLIIRHPQGHTVPRLDEEAVEKLGSWIRRVDGDYAEIGRKIMKKEEESKEKESSDWGNGEVKERIAVEIREGEAVEAVHG